MNRQPGARLRALENLIGRNARTPAATAGGAYPSIRSRRKARINAGPSKTSPV